MSAKMTAPQYQHPSRQQHVIVPPPSRHPSQAPLSRRHPSPQQLLYNAPPQHTYRPPQYISPTVNALPVHLDLHPLLFNTIQSSRPGTQALGSRHLKCHKTHQCHHPSNHKNAQRHQAKSSTLMTTSQKCGKSTTITAAVPAAWSTRILGPL